MAGTDGSVRNSNTVKYIDTPKRGYSMAPLFRLPNQDAFLFGHFCTHRKDIRLFGDSVPKSFHDFIWGQATRHLAKFGSGRDLGIA
ncbi:MAG: hypothetical protein QNK24_09100, partial [Desulfuromusa sp.]|nr:hypothetical protein [Desulfuromusa sp.]